MDSYSGNRLIQEVFSWSIQDVLNQNLYKDKVRQIPKTFSSVAHYRNSFTFPLLEETRADLYSSMMDVSLAPVSEISYIEKSMDFKEPDDLVYDVGVMKTTDAESGSDLYVPENGDLLALAELRPKSIGDLSWSNGSYKVALVRKKKRFDDEDFDEIQILSSKPIEEQDMLKKLVQKTDFAVFLTNMKTNNRIWKALNLLGEKNMNIIIQVLQTDSTVVDNCADCFLREKHYVDSTTLGASICSFDLNDSQKEAVLSSIAARECRHRNSVKLIWGPPGTGKTKTVGAILFAFFKRKCKTLTCAPTNVAVVEVMTRLLKLVTPHPDYHTYGLGDIILLGNGERMKIDKRDDLLDVFLDYRTHMLSNCFAPLSGWNYLVRLLICLLEDPYKLYHEYLEKQHDGKKDENFKTQENGTLGNANLQNNQEKKGDINDNIFRNHDNNIWRKFIFQTLEESKRTWKEKFCHRKDGRFKRSRKEGTAPLSQNHEIEGLTFDEYVKWKFSDCKNQMKMLVVIMCTHLPTSFISLKVLKMMTEFLEFLELLDSLLHMVDERLIPAFTEPINEISRNGFSKQSKPREARKQCLEMLKTLHGIFTLPDVLGKDKIRSFCLKNSRLIFCTASTSAKLFKEDMSQLEMLIVDEAAQLKECESTIPSQLPGLRHAILIGDECQLPAMIKSKVSEKAEFGRSLFQRLAQLGHKKHLLNVQYRMHPSISLFPNMEFYGKQILDAPSVKERSYRKRFLQGKMYGYYSFINVAYGCEKFDDGPSGKNMVEIAVVSAIVANLFKESVAMKERLSVGVISPYNAQVCALENKLGKTSSMESDSGFSISVRSVDGFQGGEEDIIVISTVRSNPMGLVGFLSNPQRTNVALTRARYCLWIVGDGVTLSNSESVWERLITDAKARGCFHNADEDKMLIQAIITTLIEDEKFAQSPNLNLATRWKVSFDEGFFNSFARINSMKTRNEVILALKKLLTGWREPDEVRDLTITNGVSSKLLEKCKIDGWLYLVWTVDILEDYACFFQVLKVWGVLPLSGMANLAKQVDIIYGKYTVDQINRCNLRCVEGNLQVPMTWPVHSDDLLKDDPIELLCIQFASFSLSDQSEASANCHSFRHLP